MYTPEICQSWKETRTNYCIVSVFHAFSTVYMSNKNSMELNTSQTWKVWKMMLLFVLRRCFIWTLCIIWQSTATTLPCPPAVYPHDNTWSIFAQKDITVEFVHVLTGAHGGNQWKVRIKTFQNGATPSYRISGVQEFISWVLITGCFPDLFKFIFQIRWFVWFRACQIPHSGESNHHYLKNRQIIHLHYRL